MEKEIKIECPKGHEIDKENSTFECIKFKPIKTQKSWNDLSNISGYTVANNGSISYYSVLNTKHYIKNIFATEKLAKSALALAQISQLIENFYGGIITTEEWNATDILKYTIRLYNNGIMCTLDKLNTYRILSFIAFRTVEYRDLFLEEQQELLKQYFMID